MASDLLQVGIGLTWAKHGQGAVGLKGRFPERVLKVTSVSSNHQEITWKMLSQLYNEMKSFLFLLFFLIFFLVCVC